MLGFDVLRLTPLRVVDDMRTAVAEGEAFGLERQDSDDPGCVGLKAHGTGVILIEAERARATFPPACQARLASEGATYAYVRSLEPIAKLAPRRVFGDVAASPGLREVVIEGPFGLMVLAEKTAA